MFGTIDKSAKNVMIVNKSKSSWLDTDTLYSQKFLTG